MDNSGELGPATPARREVGASKNGAEVLVPKVMRLWLRPGDESLPVEELVGRRIQILRACRQNLQVRVIAQERSRRSLEFWIDNFAWTLDPRVTPSRLPFLLYPHQRGYLRWRLDLIEAGEHGLLEKSRDQGASWMNVAHHVWALLFQRGHLGLIASRKEKMVDSLGDPSCLFEKARYLIRFCPRWMVPRHKDGFCKLINLSNGSTITGEAGENIGRGGRSTFVDLDEAAFLQRANLVESALSQNSPVVFWTSTPCGMSNLFARKRHGGNIAVYSLHWLDDPRKNQWVLGDRVGQGRDAPEGAIYPWYEAQKRQLEPITVAQELDIDYTASVEGVFIPAAWVRAAIAYPLAPVGLPVCGLDVATEGKNRNVAVIRRGPKVEEIDDWQGLDTTQSAFRVVEFCRDWECLDLAFDGDGVGAGVAGALAAMPGLTVGFEPIHGGGRPTNAYWEGEQKAAHEKFQNRRAECWGNLRERFRRTYEVSRGLMDWPPESLISIPNHQDLIAQLSSVTKKNTTSGKVQLESKKEMRRRGIASPDYADALAYAFTIEAVPRSRDRLSLGPKRSAVMG